jgi:hypothetical protein
VSGVVPRTGGPGTTLWFVFRVVPCRRHERSMGRVRPDTIPHSHHLVTSSDIHGVLERLDWEFGIGVAVGWIRMGGREGKVKLGFVGWRGDDLSQAGPLISGRASSRPDVPRWRPKH